MARSMILGSELDDRLWGEAILTAAYISNRTMRRNASCTTFELCTGRKPRVDHLLTLGTKVQIKINDQHFHKFDARTEDAYIIGFTHRSNTYKVLCKKDMVTKITCDLIVRDHLGRESPDNTESENEMVHFSLNSGKETRKPNPILASFFDGFLSELRAEVNSNQQPSESTDVTSPSFSIAISGLDTQYQSCVEPRKTSTPKATNPFSDVEESTLREEVNLTIEQSGGMKDEKPSLYLDAVTGKNKARWLQAIKEELDAHEINGT